ncbi:MAG: hypothetical protein LBS19_07445 [Clostridiales bacterium]|jgi:hypothetical protein|nr:hypothetical protein [Clostridiales bacterium]
MENLFIVEKAASNEELIVKGFAERETAHNNGLRHVTTIIVPFICDGPEKDKGKWVVIDRFPREIAKGKKVIKKGVECKRSLNLVGGHCSTEINGNLLEHPLPVGIIKDGAMRELREEVRLGDSDFSPEEVLEIGLAQFASVKNVEYSMIYATPIRHDKYEALRFFDDIIADGIHRDIALDKAIYSQNKLMDMHYNDPETEICDAITRLFDDENKQVKRTLDKKINEFIEEDEKQERRERDAYANSMVRGTFQQNLTEYGCYPQYYDNYLRRHGRANEIKPKKEYPPIPPHECKFIVRYDPFSFGSDGVAVSYCPICGRFSSFYEDTGSDCDSGWLTERDEDGRFIPW